MKNLEAQGVLEIGTKVKFVNGNANHLITGTIIDKRSRGLNHVEYLFSEIYGDHNQHESRVWLGFGNVKEIIK